MSTRWTERVWCYETTDPKQRLLLLAIADTCDHSGAYHDSIDHLARRCLRSVRSVERHLVECEGIGAIQREVVNGLPQSITLCLSSNPDKNPSPPSRTLPPLPIPPIVPLSPSPNLGGTLVGDVPKSMGETQCVMLASDPIVIHHEHFPKIRLGRKAKELIREGVKRSANHRRVWNAVCQDWAANNWKGTSVPAMLKVYTRESRDVVDYGETLSVYK